jgi:hypothetical protein
MERAFPRPRGDRATENVPAYGGAIPIGDWAVTRPTLSPQGRGQPGREGGARPRKSPSSTARSLSRAPRQNNACRYATSNRSPGTRICRNVFQTAACRGRRVTLFSLQIGRADARTRTGDPFITSDEPVAAPVRSSHSGPLSMRGFTDWGGLEVTREDNLVDGWWTPDGLPFKTTSCGRRHPSRGCGANWIPLAPDSRYDAEVVSPVDPLHAGVDAASFDASSVPRSSAHDGSTPAGLRRGGYAPAAA